ncbi:O-antigen ligase family protein [Bradyrhizobium diazoefficiens]|nr:O-antigen ligase family protein [Bradyrhizobium diazoefficiens]MBR0964117.1 O-antigen ligase family protein [Bradyrhizobium diazoefficiens]MBR0978277.1 O-antigen ligase family protein [Bradyrhizobium diazoefficiens]MBR1006208.1 O-antigen ligase family protein [Bradyrhizobium diazoefficiens]MBR1014260.1 O-antigen ligase family protein [Bradyrhizobium diazoefficiens]MBR1050397.1 O-antigen ligase family protein [Bradyrhizobium diazoefficiens]
MTISATMANPNASRPQTVAVLVAFWAWCVLLSFPMIGMTEDFADVPTAFGSGGGVLLGQIAGLVLFVLTLALARPVQLLSSLGRTSLPQAAIIVIIYLSMVLQLQGEEGSTLIGIFYTTLLLVTALTLSAVWTLQLPDLETGFGVASVIFCLFGISALVILGLPENRNVGGIQPNLFAAPLLMAFIFSLFRAGVISIGVRIACFAMIALVSSRFAMIGCVTAFAVYTTAFKRLDSWKIATLVVALMVAIPLWPHIVTILALDDPNRDLSSGFTGRDEYWYSALSTISNHPLGIGFKRATAFESGHNGYLKTLVEFGLVGGGLIIFLFAVTIASAGVDAARSTERASRERRFACARLAGLVALAFGAFFQPQLLSLGDAFGVTLLLLLFRPRTTPAPHGAPATELHAPAIPG